jgi:hypothetical protein
MLEYDTNRQEAAVSTTELARVTSALARALSMDDVNQIGLDTGPSERLRTVTPHRLLLSTVAGLSGGQVESLADLLREFNHQNDVTVAYKAFYNRLARPGFAKVMHQIFDRLIERLRMQTLTPTGHTAVSRFKDIVIQDGSSFALKKKLRDVFPGRFTTSEPAAIEIHATYSGFSDEVCSIQIALDKEADRQFLPDPSTLKDRLLLADTPTSTSPQASSGRASARQLSSGSSPTRRSASVASRSPLAASRCAPGTSSTRS